ncbi:hypothetical protein BH10CYA1_BH10CYA1_61090 [soil metagenome]
MKGEGINAEFVQIDLTDAASIGKASSVVQNKYGKLDILVNNAGIADQKDGMPSAVSMEAVEKTMNTNFFGALRVTQAMLPLLKEAKDGSIVNVSSGLGSLTLNGDTEWPYWITADQVELTRIQLALFPGKYKKYRSSVASTSAEKFRVDFSAHITCVVS